MRSLTTALLLVALLALPSAAQQGDLASTRVLESRAELEALLEELQATAESTAYSSSLRRRARDEARIVEERLRDGDFRVGDRVYLQVTLQGQPWMADTVRVVQGPSVFLPEIGEIELGGVLRSELSDHMRTALGRFLIDPRVEQASSFVRMGFTGAVMQQGELYVPAEALVGEALSAAGVAAGANLEEVTIRRSGEVLWDETAVAEARRQGRTLDQMNLRAGDEFDIPAQTAGAGWATVLQIGVGLLGTIGILLTAF
jgi:protein involved in polysaccharide export with SLBB domain